MKSEIESLIIQLAHDHVDEALCRECGQTIFVAQDLEMNEEDLNLIMDYLGLNEDDYLI